MWNNRIVGYENKDPKELMPNPKNWRTHPNHQMNSLKGVMNEVGLVQNVIFNVRTGHLVDGHLRVDLAIKENQTSIPVTLVDLSAEEEAIILATIDPIAAQAGVDSEQLQKLLQEVLVDDPALSQLIKSMANDEKMHWDNLTGELTPLDKKPKPKPRYHDPRLVDAIFTWTYNGDGFIDIALRSGLDYGIRSGTSKAHPSKNPMFIDNQWENYDHSVHMDCIEQYRPKYCTVMDLLTKEHAEQLGITYYDFDAIMKMAEHASRYAENVIVIPKFDCIHEIPEKYMLGYSVPSTYGGTPLPFERFIGRKIHLLGGSQRMQWELYNSAPESVVSVDTNYLCKVSTYGNITNFSFMAEEWNVPPEKLKAHDLKSFLHGEYTNPLYIAFCLNVGYYAAMWKRVSDQPSMEGIESLEELEKEF